MTANRRVSRVVVLTVAGAVTAMAIGLLVWSGSWTDPSTLVRPAAPRMSDGSYRPDAAPEADGRHVFGVPVPGEGERSERGEPADLPAPPGGRRLTRSTRDLGGDTLEFSVWEVADGNTARLASFYKQVATDAGFSFVRSTVDSDSGTHRLFMRRGPRTLQIDCRPAAEAVRVVVQLR